jgi:transcription elongation factor Elf1
MVHYDPRKTAQDPPPLCPKCGSHRTAIVGISEELKVVVIRCAACGQTTQIPLGVHAEPAKTSR